MDKIDIDTILPSEKNELVIVINSNSKHRLNIHNKLELKYNKNNAIYDYTVNISDFNLDRNGLYSCYFDNDVEFHHFILIVE